MEPKESDIYSRKYDRYCHQIDKEDNLMDQRVNWLLMSQAILFAAIGVSNDNIAEITLIVIPFVGFFCSLGIGLSLLAAIRSLTRYRKILKDVCPSGEDIGCCYPQLHRRKNIIRLGLVPPIVLPFIFCTAWIVVFILSHC